MLDLIKNIDRIVVLDLAQHNSDGFLSNIMKLVTLIGNDGLIWIAVSILLFALKKKRIGFESLMALSFSYTLTETIKHLVSRPRPFQVLNSISLAIEPPAESSFPSGHTATSFAVAIIIYLHMPKKYGVLALILASVMGFSRVYLGVHYPSDVFGGLLLGILSGLIIDYITNKGLTYRSKIYSRKD